MSQKCSQWSGGTSEISNCKVLKIYIQIYFYCVPYCLFIFQIASNSSLTKIHCLCTSIKSLVGESHSVKSKIDEVLQIKFSLKLKANYVIWTVTLLAFVVYCHLLYFSTRKAYRWEVNIYNIIVSHNCEV